MTDSIISRVVPGIGVTIAFSSSRRRFSKLDLPALTLVRLQPLRALDYSKASTYMQLMNDDFCSVPEFTGVKAQTRAF